MYYDNKDYSTLSLDDICEELSIGRHTASTLLNNGVIVAFQVANSWRIPAYRFAEYIDRSCERTQASINAKT